MTNRSPRTAARTALVSILLFSFASSPLRAEEAPPRSGQRVRVTAASPAFTGTTVGTLVKNGPDHIVLVDPRTGAVTELPLASVTQIEVSHPRNHARTGALIGAGMGVFAGVLVGVGYSEAGCGDPGGPFVECGGGAGVGIAAGVAVGAFWGVVGHWLGGKSKVDVWTDASAGRLKVSIAPLRDGGRASLSLSF